MEQKKYEFVRSDKSKFTKTLAMPSPSRLRKLMELFGVQSFKEMLNEKLLEQTCVRLDLGLDEKKLADVLDICLVEGHAGLELNHPDFDLRETDGVVQDFFDQRSKMFRERQN